MADFVRAGSAGRAGECFDEWIQQGLTHAEATRGSTWPTVFASGAPWAFLYRPPRAAHVREGLVGVLSPSMDAVGRRFPFVVCAPALAECASPWPHVLPMAFGDFLDGAAAVLLDDVATTSVADVESSLRRVPLPLAGGAEAAAYDYDAWAASTALAQAWAAIYGSDGLSAVGAVRTIVDAVAPFRGEEAPETRLALRLPLGAGGVAAAAFWIDTIRRLASSPAEVRTCFWSFDGRSGSMLLQLGTTPPSAFGELWAPDRDSEYVCDLTAPSGSDVHGLAASLPRVAEALVSPGARVRDFLEVLGGA